MSKFILFFLSLILFFSCEKKDKKINETSIDSTSLEIPPPPNTYNEFPSPQERLEKWVDYYKSKEADFKLENFQKVDTFKVFNQPATAIPSFSSKFDQRYQAFLTYNADSSKYVDIDSYLLRFSDNGKVDYNTDQEIVLVDLNQKKAHRILFYGPSFWVEDAFFKNDSTLMLLENNNDRVPGYQEINLNTMISTAYTYRDTLGFDSKYYSDRVHQILNKNQKIIP